jgi:hypothetical protein
MSAVRTALRLLLASWLSFALFGCATVPPAPVLHPFERCMAEVGRTFYYTSDRVKAADWCNAHDNGGIK